MPYDTYAIHHALTISIHQNIGVIKQLYSPQKDHNILQDLSVSDVDNFAM